MSFPGFGFPVIRKETHLGVSWAAEGDGTQTQPRFTVSGPQAEAGCPGPAGAKRPRGDAQIGRAHV